MLALWTACMSASAVGGEKKNIFTPNEMRITATTAMM
jgi:hypothetical protein